MATKRSTDDDVMDHIAMMVVNGEIEILSINANPCLPCVRNGIDGTLKSDAQPNWMNRWVCDKCGIEVSR